MGAEGERAGPGAPRQDRTWWWWIGVWLLWTVVGDEIARSALDRLVSVGGYGFSNAVLGLLALGGCFIAVQRTRVKHEKLETHGDPAPLPAPYDYETQAKAGLFMGWAGGIVAWAGTLAWLAFLGPAPALALGPVLGTTLVIYGRMEMAHAQVMDAWRGRPPAPAP